MEPGSSRGLPVWLLLLGTLGAIVGFCWSEQDYVSATVLAATALSGLWGYYVGAMRLLGYLGSLAAMYGWGPSVGRWLAPIIMQQLETSPGATRWIALVAGSALVLLVVQMVVRVVSGRLLSERPRLESANRLLGFGVGGVQGAVAIALLLGAILVAEPFARKRLAAGGATNAHPLARSLARRVTEIAHQTRRSTLGAYVVTWNPFDNLKQLQGLHRAATVVSNPEKLESVIRSSRNDKFRQLAESLKQDPEIRKLSRPGQPIDEKSAWSLLNHPGVAKLLDDPDLMKELAGALDP